MMRINWRRKKKAAKQDDQILDYYDKLKRGGVRK